VCRVELTHGSQLIRKARIDLRSDVQIPIDEGRAIHRWARPVLPGVRMQQTACVKHQ
jgi:hypothetical protein